MKYILYLSRKESRLGTHTHWQFYLQPYSQDNFGILYKLYYSIDLMGMESIFHHQKQGSQPGNQHILFQPNCKFDF